MEQDTQELFKIQLEQTHTPQECASLLTAELDRIRKKHGIGYRSGVIGALREVLVFACTHLDFTAENLAVTQNLVLLYVSLQQQPVDLIKLPSIDLADTIEDSVAFSNCLNSIERLSFE